MKTARRRATPVAPSREESKPEPWLVDVPAHFKPKPELAREHFVRRVRDVILCAVPRRTTVLIISDGDDGFLDRLHHRDPLHFPHDANGAHIGPPADGLAAVAALETSRGGGAQFLVIPASAQSWLERYPELARHLERNCRLIAAEPATCDIYALTDEMFADDRDADLEPEPPDLSPIRAIAPGDLGYRAEPNDYFLWGWHGLRCVERGLEAAHKETVESILDLPSGHGRVLRTLKARFPEARLTACDIDRDGVDFCAEVLGATGVYSEEDPADVVLPDTYDLIWCGSLLTHLSAERCKGFIELFKAHLRAGGVLVFTTHGRLYADLLRHEAFNSSVADPQELVRDYDRSGFGYQDYMFGVHNVGFTLSSPAWVCRELERHPELKLVLLAERGWGNIQDIVTCVRVPDGEIDAFVTTHRQRLEEQGGVEAREKVVARYRNLVEYREMLERIKDVTPATVAQGSTVAVASRGDEDLLDIEGVRAWHFPRDEDGGYAGHYPSDSAAAIEQLEALRAQGADYFLLPASGLWWLEHYREFAEHLRSRYPARVEADDTCIIFSLRD